jgi:DNA repair exonuclease SbcCD ATPase subunit
MVKSWKNKTGKTCVECGRAITEDYTESRIQPYLDKINTHASELSRTKEAKTKLDETIRNAEQALRTKHPSMTVSDAKSIHNQHSRHQQEIKRLQDSIAKIQQETNPHTESIERTKSQIVSLKNNITELENNTVKHNTLYNHYNYIYKAYNDRAKIKNYVFQDHIPFINNRLKHYLEVFGLDVQISLTPSLGITSNLWGYEFESGGERKRTDVAFMLAMFDFHERMYGRQCNIMVLDEVDGRMDDDGIDGLINIIKNDLANRVEAVLIISHRGLMFDTFPKEIRVSRMASGEHRGFSQLEIL